MLARKLFCICNSRLGNRRREHADGWSFARLMPASSHARNGAEAERYGASEVDAGSGDQQ
jgi:hypothetical protein